MSIDRFFRKVRTIITADRRQRSLIIKSVLMIGLFRFLLELFPFKTSRRVIARLGRGVVRENPPSRPEDIAAAVKVASGNLLRERKSTRLNSSHVAISYAVFCLKKKILIEW